MSDYILSPDTPTVHPADTPPSLPSRRAEIVEQRCLAELREIASALHDRRRPPIEILSALHHHARLLALAHGYRLHAMLSLVRELPGLERWCPVEEGERVEADWRRRALALADWLTRHAGEGVAEEAVRVAEEIAARHIEEADYGERTVRSGAA